MAENPVAVWLEAELARVEEIAQAAESARAQLWRVPMSAHSAVNAFTDTVLPSAVLRRVVADRALLADLQAERHLVVDGDCWFTCPAATEERDGGENCDDRQRGWPCNCGRDARVERRVRLLVEAYGWTEETHG